MDAAELARVYEAFQDFHDYFGPAFGRKQPRELSRHYLQGLLVQSQERRNAENLSEAVASSPRALQRFLTESPWDDDVVIGRLQEYLGPRLEDPQGVWVLDGSDFPKQGVKSVGVARQYCGTLGKIANCQAGVFLAHVGPRGRALVDKRLYLPKEWTSDVERCAAAGVLITAVELVNDPTDYAMLIPMLQRVEEMTEVKAPLTLADAGYHSAASLQGCVDRGQQVVMPEPSRGRALDHPYHKDRFTCDPESDTYSCPQGQALRLVRSRFTGGVNKRMYQAQKIICQASPVAGACIRRGTSGRSLVISPYDTTLLRHRAWMATEEARSALKKRKQLVEPVFGIIKEQQGA